MQRYKRHGDYNAWSMASIVFWALMTGLFVMAVFALTGAFR